jgi:hypothetical protein
MILPQKLKALRGMTHATVAMIPEPPSFPVVDLI